jgi:hypothetical protein
MNEKEIGGASSTYHGENRGLCPRVVREPGGVQRILLKIAIIV